MKPSLNRQILLGAGVGIVLGLSLHHFGVETQSSRLALYLCDILGSIFVNLLKMILIPLVFASISVGIANLRVHAQMGKVWKLTLVYFLTTTALAVLLGLTLVNIFKPGQGLKLSMFQDTMASFSTKSLTLPEFIKTFVTNLFVNPISAMASGDVLATVIFAMFLGIALVVSGEKAKGLIHLLNEFFDLIMLMVGWIMRIAPFGIMGLLAKLIATQNVSLLATLAKFIAVVMGGTLFHGVIVLPGILYIFTRRNLAQFFNGARDAFVTAFSTSSSSATLPVTMRCVKENLKVDKDIAGFVLPLGATVNMDGTALYEATAAIFVANLAGIELNLMQQIVVFFMAILASIGAPGIPSAGMVTMIMVLQSVGLPVEAIAILLPIDRPLDAVRTMVNVEGDMVGSVLVDHFVHKRKR